MESSLVVRAVFALLVAATAGAFVLAQNLKTEEPLVLRFSVKPRHISPNGDTVREQARVGFDITEPAEVSFAVIDSEGEEVRRIVDDRRLAGDTRHRFFWDGRDADGRIVPDGTYRLRVIRRQENRVVDSFKTVRVDTEPPRVELVSAEPNVLAPGLRGGARRVRLRYRGPRNVAPEFRVFRTDGRGEPELVRLFRGDDTRTGVWDGTVRGGGPTPSGNYAFNVKVRDLAGNKTEAPARIPDAGDARPDTGVTVSRFSLQGPMGVVPAGSVAVLRVGPVARRFQFALSRLGSSRAIRRDRRRGARLRVRIPRRARTGVYLARVRSAGRRAVWPLAVAGVPPRRASGRPRPLVVLPVVTWQGRNKVDSDHDGFTDTLASARAIPPQRPFAGGRLPGSFHAEATPLLRYLDRERLPYDLTTDLSLARREGPTIGNAPGVAIAGTAAWVPRRVRNILREEVERRGLKVVSFGGGSLRRTVSLLDGMLRGPSSARGSDLFGESTRLFSTDPAAPLRAEADRLGLFRGVDSLFGEFSRFERSLALPDGARLLSSAGRDEGEPAFVAYRLGRGTVVRPGTPQWTRELSESRLSVEVPRVTRRIWSLLARPR